MDRITNFFRTIGRGLKSVGRVLWTVLVVVWEFGAMILGGLAGLGKLLD